MELPPVVAELKATISEFTSKMHEAKGEMKTVESEGSSSFSKLGGVATGVLAGAGAVAVGFAASSVKAALESGKADALLEQAITNVGGSMEEMHPKIDATVDKMAKFGFTDVQVDDALAKLTASTGDPAKALENMGLVADFARAKHVDLTTAAQTVGKVMNGNVGALSRLGISTKDAAGHTLSAAAAMAMLNQRFGGAAQAEAGTYAGKMEAFKAQMENFQVKVGQALIPVLVKLMSVLMAVIQWFEKHKTVALALGITIAAILVPAILAMVAGWVASAAAMVIAMAPILAIVVAIAALVAAVIFLWTNWDQIWNFIMEHKAIAAIILILGGPVVAIIAIVGILKFLWENWSQIWTDVQNWTQAVWLVLQAIWNAMVGAITGAIDTIKGVITGGLDAIKGAWDAAWGAVTGALTGAWNTISGAVTTGVSTIVGIITGLPGQAATALADLGSTLAGVAKSAFDSMFTAAVAGAATVVGVAQELPNKIVSGVGDLSRTLWNAGVSVITGLIGGIGSMLGSLKDKLGDIAGDIVSWKGPPEKDFTLLQPAGRLLMQGLIVGAQSQLPSTEQFFRGVGPNLAGQVGAPVGRAGATVHIEHLHATGPSQARAISDAIGWELRKV